MLETLLACIEASRLIPPVPFFIIYVPHFTGFIHGALVTGAKPTNIQAPFWLLILGSLFLCNALHVWNDIIDAPIDRNVERTKNRPIARGAVSQPVALLFTAVQALFAFLALQPLPSGSILYAFPNIALWAFYPYAKRTTNYPQVVLGFAIAWAAFMGSVSLGLNPFTIQIGSLVDMSDKARLSLWCQFSALVLWVVINDTIYAFQDLRDDLKHGVKSMAVQYRSNAKPMLWSAYALLLGLLALSGILLKLGACYFLGSVGTTSLFMGCQIARVKLDQVESIKWWFTRAYAPGAAFMSLGLVLEYLQRRSLLA